MATRPQRGKAPSWLVVVGVAAFLLLALGLWLFSPDEAATDQNRASDDSSQTDEPSQETAPEESEDAEAEQSPAPEPAESESGENESGENGSGETDVPSENGGVDPESGLSWISEADLPPEAWDTLQLIDDGGPYPYDEDDGTFGNFEGVLPDRERGYYREYTVETPGLSHRGALRIVTGSDGEFYWTEDHYASFERIDRPGDSR